MPSVIFRVKGDTDRTLKILAFLRIQRMYHESMHVFSTFSRESRFSFTIFGKKCSRTSHYGPAFITHSSLGSKNVKLHILVP